MVIAASASPLLVVSETDIISASVNYPEEISAQKHEVEGQMADSGHGRFLRTRCCASA